MDMHLQNAVMTSSGDRRNLCLVGTDILLCTTRRITNDMCHHTSLSPHIECTLHLQKELVYCILTHVIRNHAIIRHATIPTWGFSSLNPYRIERVLLLACKRVIAREAGRHCVGLLSGRGAGVPTESISTLAVHATIHTHGVGPQTMSWWMGLHVKLRHCTHPTTTIGRHKDARRRTLAEPDSPHAYLSGRQA